MHRFRFGVVGTDARRAEELGYATLLVPGFEEAARAAAVTSRLRVSTWTADGSPRVVARRAAELGAATGGRFELGLDASLASRVSVVRGVPLVVSGVGSGCLRVVASKADTVAFPRLDDGELAAELDELYELAGDRFDALEIGMSYEPSGPVSEQVDLLLRRRDRLGVSYFSVPGSAMESFAPVVALLAGV